MAHRDPGEPNAVTRAARAFALALATLCASSAAPAQPCEAVWEAPFQRYDPVEHPVRLMSRFTDDATGSPRLFVYSGYVDTGPFIPMLQQFDGQAMRPMGQIEGEVRQALEFDDGSGPALYISGPFTVPGTSIAGLARWRGGVWHAVGANTTFGGEPMVVFDDGAGPRLHTVGQVQGHTRTLVRWNGTAWESLGPMLFGHITAICAAEGGPLRGIIIGGSALAAGNPPFSRLLRWDGAQWQAGFGAQPYISAARSLAYFEGPGETSGVYAYTETYGSTTLRSLYRLDGQTWAEAPPDVPRTFMRVIECDGADRMFFIDDSSTIRSWDGASMRTEGPSTYDIRTFEYFTPPGAEEALHIGGGFDERWQRWDGPVYFAHLRDGEWSRFDNGPRHVVDCLAQLDLGDGPAVYATMAAGHDSPPESHIVLRLQGDRWRTMMPIPGSKTSISALITYDPPGRQGPPTLYATFGSPLPLNHPSATYGGIAKWDGQAWQRVGDGVTNESYGPQTPGEIFCATVFDDGQGAGPQLYVGGEFSHAGGVHTGGIARWNGEAWSGIGATRAYSVDGLAVHGDAADAMLYMAGVIIPPGSFWPIPVARYDGFQIKYLPSPTSGPDTYGGYAIGVYRDDGVPTVVAAGPSFGVAAWRGAAWEPMVNAPYTRLLRVYSLAALGEGPTQQLVASGWSTGPVARSSPSQASSFGLSRVVAVWDKGRWSLPTSDVALRTGPHDIGNDILPVVDAQGPALMVGGSFTRVDATPSDEGRPAARIAILRSLHTSCQGDTDFDGFVGMSDLNAVLSDFGAPPQQALPALARAGDINLDGYVDFYDLAILLAAFGSTCE